MKCAMMTKLGRCGNEEPCAIHPYGTVLDHAALYGGKPDPAAVTAAQAKCMREIHGATRSGKAEAVRTFLATHPAAPPEGYRHLGDAERLPRPRARASVVVPLCRTLPDRRGGAAWAGQRRRSPDLGKLEFPGGTCEPGELHLEGARRELREEAGLAVDAGRLRLLAVVTYPEGSTYPSCDLAVYVLDLRLGERPLDTEPLVRGPWVMVPLVELKRELARGHLRGGACAAVGALCGAEVRP